LVTRENSLAVNKSDLITKVVRDVGITRSQAEAVVDSFFSAIVLALKKGDRVVLASLGRFNVHRRPSGMGRNPQTGQPIRLPSTSTVSFVPRMGLMTAAFKKKAKPHTGIGTRRGKSGSRLGRRGKGVAGPSKLVDYDVVKIFYATDRAIDDVNHPGTYYGAARSKNGKLDLGQCEVSVPIDRLMGSLSGNSWKKIFHPNDPKYWVLLQAVQPQMPDEFYSNLKAKVGESTEKEAFVFIHGYNVAFEDAACRTGQLAYDLQFKGAAILYSWPSQGEETKYMVDENNIEWTIPHLREFLEAVASNSGATKIHLIAHSMGNRALVRALEYIAIRQPAGLGPLFRQIVLTAPDIDADVFKQLAVRMKDNATRITLYASSNDKALKVSEKIHGFPRAGESGQNIVIFPGIDTMDASLVDTSFIGHSYYGDNKSILSDLFNLLAEEKPPDQRFGVREKQSDQGIYWLFRP
jgi:esterase/lipase superfamily enzyme/nucleoid DNA-binding protein